MNKQEAKKLACSFLTKSIELECSDKPPQALYGFNPAKDYLFTFQLFGSSSIGSSQYLAVSRETGEVRYLGRFGE
ncbi:MAG: hypothetical protein HQ556_01725 [Candidatus Marinimicrobia bacterium]|nr:hypothetical protein [Candidatus Neomarinimicrobiota bacterium]